MKAASFDYAAARTIDEAIEHLQRPGARVLAGGQSLVPLMNMRAVMPSALVDINRLPALGHVEIVGGEVVIGAVTRQRRAELDPHLRRACPMIGEAAAAVGNVSVRNRGTVVGSIAHAEPFGEWPTVFLALDGVCSVRGPRGKRAVRATDLFVGRGKTSLAADEMIVEITMRLPSGGSAWIELARRVGDLPIVGVAAAMSLGGGERIESCAIALGGVADTPIRATTAERSLIGTTPTPADLDELADFAVEGVDPPADVHGDSAYRRRVAATLVGRALHRAHARARKPDRA